MTVDNRNALTCDDAPSSTIHRPYDSNEMKEVLLEDGGFP
jgi:hypothetical protein